MATQNETTYVGEFKRVLVSKQRVEVKWKPLPSVCLRPCVSDQTVCQIFMKFSTEVFRGKVNFAEVAQHSHTLLKGVNKFVPLLSKFLYRSGCKYPRTGAENCEFRENRFSKSRTLLMAVKDISKISSDLDKITYQRCTQKFME
jgi:hypothetical protein